jgi:hypothetical protein
VRAEIRAAVKRVLRRHGVCEGEADFEPFITRFMEQAEAHEAEWPLVALTVKNRLWSRSISASYRDEWYGSITTWTA